MTFFKVASSKDNPVIFSFLFFLIFAFFFTSSAFGQINFAPKVDYGTGLLPRSVFATDLDGDNDFDLAVANGVSATVSVLKNNGDGTFAAKVDYATGDGPISVFAADLDGDLDKDLAVANNDSNTVSVLKNNGDGTFAAKVDYATGINPFSVFAADLDGDNDFDLAVANNDSNTVSVLKNNGDGTFAPRQDYTTGSFPQSVFAADLDGDTDKDLAVANQGGNTVSVLKNNGDGTFAAKVDYVTDQSPRSVFAADLDGDTDLDLAVADGGSNQVSVLKNNGDGTFAPRQDHTTGSFPHSVFAADLDGDTDFDLAVTNLNSNTVSVLKNNFNVIFGIKVDYATGINPFSVFAADLDGDLDNDLAVANQTSTTVSVLKNLTPRPFIVSISDEGNDQGKQVRISWKTNVPGDTLVKKYEIYRRIDGSTSLTINGAVSASNPLPANWELVDTFPAYGDTAYNGIVPTLVDSTVNEGLQWSVFFVRAVADSFVISAVFWDSPIDSGYSVDNLVPSPPSNLQATGTAAIASLHWSPVSDEDFDFYYIYRDTLSGFTLSPAKRVKATSDTLASDTLSNLNKPYFYQVTAVDFSGNEGPPSNQVQLCSYKAGDASGDNNILLSDIVVIINFLFRAGPTPNPLCRGDANGNGTVLLPDIVYLINFIFKSGPAPIKSGVCCL